MRKSMIQAGDESSNPRMAPCYNKIRGFEDSSPACETNHERRSAFTLIELLVVIAIIGILVGLLTAAVMAILDRQYEVRAAAEIRMLETALVQFKEKYGVYPPSKIVLKSDRADYTAADGDSSYYLDRILGRAGANFTGMNWGIGVTKGSPKTLDGDQCLVFFLSGNFVNVIGSFYPFESNRLWIRSNNCPSFLDPRENVPYAYFNSGRKVNGYSSDCSTLSTGKDPSKPACGTPSPYTLPSSTTAFHNKDTVQIIYAGRDMKFGSGSWDPANPGNVAINGADDRTNFCGNILAAGN